MSTNAMRFKNKNESVEEYKKRQCEYVKKHYYNSGGRYKSLIKYYKRKFKDDEDAMDILNDEDLSLEEKYKEIKYYNMEKTMEKKLSKL